MLTKDKIAFAILSGVLLFLAFSPNDQSYFAYIAFVPILIAIDELTPKEAFILGSIMGFVFCAGHIYWIYIFNILALPAMLIVFAIYFGVTFFIYKYIADRLFFITTFLFPAVLVSIEFLRSSGYFGFPWGVLGYSQYNFTILIQLAEITGVFGISFLVALANTTIAFLFLSKFTFNRILIEGVAVLIIFFIVFLYGYDTQKKFSEIQEYINVAMLQPNFDLYEDYWINRNKRFKILYELCLRAAYEKPEIIVFPESVIPEYIIEYDVKTNKHYFINQEWYNFFKNIFNKYSGYILLNTNFEKKQNEYYNSAFLINSNLEILKRYDKIHLVPFGETLPLIKKFFLMKWIAKLLGTFDYTAGTEFTLFEIEKGKFATIICFEDVFGELTRRFVKQGANFLINLTNDGWSKSAAASYQHNSLAVFRAIENRVSLFRCTNTGFTTVIDLKGNIKKEIPIQKSEILIESELVNKKIKTFYTRYGDIFANFVLLFTLLILIIAVFKPQ
ncbi:MAG TPA: apolipoprotein N-acyltransferase [bacterium]|nr:apolipoprotein N-acyltransferase [bacterium]HOL48460.1 apolipoprotein N-acyltransferase [bacterium]HPQ19962.1 apolipoprotein N-acyltransferase [bacterium]